MPSNLPEQLDDVLLQGTRMAVAAWTERSFYATKSTLLSARKCEGLVLAQSGQTYDKLHPATVVGVISHRAIQLSHTHPGKPISEYIRQGITGARIADAKIDDWFATASMAEQSDVHTQASSRVTNFLDDWPTLQDTWNPRFEEPMTAKIGRLTLSCRADLSLGRPHPDMKQTMLLVDFKSGSLHDDHYDEAGFYALVATLRHRVAPWRSAVYSLAGGDYTDPDITPQRLLETAEWIAKSVTTAITVLTDTRPAILTPGDACRFCPAAKDCLTNELNQPVPQLLAA